MPSKLVFTGFARRIKHPPKDVTPISVVNGWCHIPMT